MTFLPSEAKGLTYPAENAEHFSRLMETLPWSWYTDEEVLRREQERIFRRSWQYAGPAEHIAEPETFLASRAGDVPVVVVRDRDGELRGFVNVCRHRGSVVAEGRGRRATLQCPYHAWTYGLDGTLRAAPRADREARFDASGLSLVPVAVGTWGPFVFVNPDAEASPLSETLGRLPELVPDLATFRFHHRGEYELAANWKIACENFLECYHCPVAHPGFSAVVDVSPDAYVLEAHETFWSQFARLREEEAAPPGQFHLLFPNLKLNVYPGPANLSIGPVLPAGPERTTGYLDYFFPADADEEWIRELTAFDDQVGSEDTKLVESVQRGVRAGMIEHGQLLPQSEQLVAGFQRRVLEALER
jgi:phenylpropionate dioxygenase-like ring-hydroxylating dioxygenase large terminal subunit